MPGLPLRLLLVLALTAASLGAATLPAPHAAHAADSWIEELNAARASADLPAAAVRDDWAAPAREASRYMVLNGGLTHEPSPGSPGYTDGAKWAAGTGVLTAASWRMSPAEAVDGLLDSPGHAYWLLHPQLTEAGFGEYHDPDASPWTYAATIPVTQGIDASRPMPARTTYPGDGSAVERRPSALYVLGASLPSGSYRATVTADGRDVGVASVSRTHAEQVAVRLSAPLPLGAAVRATVRRDGEVFETFAFTTGSTASDGGSGERETAAVPPEVCASITLASFPDVDPTSTHGPAVGCVAGLGLLSGYGDGRFRPATIMSRAQAASVLDRTLAEAGLSLPAGPDVFDDVSGTHAAAIHRLAAAGIVTGTSATTFAPDADVSRAQLVTLLDRAADRLGTPLPDASTLPFGDVGEVHADAVARAAEAGITSGYPDGTFRPWDGVRRDHAASLLARWLDWRRDAS